MEQETRAAADPDKWKPGKYKAKAVDWGASKSKEGLPQAVVLFEYQQPGAGPGVTEHRQLMWFGSFKGGARERSLETLMSLGLRGPVSEIELGRDGKALDPELEVEVVVEHRIYNNVRKAGIAWVNQVGGRGIARDKFAPDEARALFADIDQEFMATLMAKGLTPKSQPQAAHQTPGQQAMQTGMFNEEDIPF
jgi:hypothetical protein